MDAFGVRMTGRQSALLTLALCALANGGCIAVAAGAAAGAGAASYAYAKGKVSYTFNASLDDTWAATRKSLAELNLPILSEERETNRSGFIRSETKDGTAVRVYLEAASNDETPGTTGTEVSVRVGTFGDYSVSDNVLRQLSSHLVAVGPGGAPGTATQPTGSWTAVNPPAIQPQPAPPIQPQTAPGVTIQPPAPPPGVPMANVPVPPSTPPPPLLPPEPVGKQ